jgi:hypothetical protein
MRHARWFVALFAVVATVGASAAAAAERHHGATAKAHWTGTITLTNDSITHPDSDQNTVETHVKITWTLIGYAGSLYLDGGTSDSYWVRVSGSYVTKATYPSACGDGSIGSMIETDRWSGPPVNLDATYPGSSNPKARPLWISGRTSSSPGWLSLTASYRYSTDLSWTQTTDNTCDGTSYTGGRGALWATMAVNTKRKLKGSAALDNNDVLSWNLKWSGKKKRKHH